MNYTLEDMKKAFEAGEAYVASGEYNRGYAPNFTEFIIGEYPKESAFNFVMKYKVVPSDEMEYCKIIAENLNEARKKAYDHLNQIRLHPHMLEILEIVVRTDAWECPDSPISICIYEPSDVMCDDCIICHEPYERK